MGEPWVGEEDRDAEAFWDLVERTPMIDYGDVYAYQAEPHAEEQAPKKGRTPGPGSPEFQAAVDAYARWVEAGDPLSGRELCRRFDVSPDNRRWPRKVIAAAEAAGEAPHAEAMF